MLLMFEFITVYRTVFITLKELIKPFKWVSSYNIFKKLFSWVKFGVKVGMKIGLNKSLTN
jgi:hypothetical protein